MYGGNKDKGVSAIPQLINRLCNHYAQDNPEVAERLFKFCTTFLSSPLPCDVEMDDDHIASQLRNHVDSMSYGSDTTSFDILYIRIIKSTSLKQKSNLLNFFLFLCNGTSKDNTWRSQMSLSYKSLSFLPDDPKVGVRKLYQGKLTRKQSNSSSKSRQTFNSNWLKQSDSNIYTHNSSSSKISVTSGLTQGQLIQEVIYSFQGIEGKIIRKESDGLGFTIDTKCVKLVSPNFQGLIMRLTGVGFFRNQLKHHCDAADKQVGLIGQSLIAVLRNELTSYYQLIATLQAQTRQPGCSRHCDLTLRRLIVWVAEPQMKLQWLAYIAEQCVDKKGGALISAIHGFLQHGARTVQKLSEKVLSAVCRPLYVMLSKWLLDGELNDPCGEFFIEARAINDVERLWHDKYHVRRAMIPSFITLEQANKILSTGKSINFLRQICGDNAELPGRDTLQRLFSDTLQTLYNPEHSIELQTALENVYRETSARVLDLLKNKFMLLEHIQAMRKYILLGQGDFIRHLLELLAPELSQPASNLYAHTLSAILESAVRVTNAQYEDEETISRLNVCLMQHANEDTGWDVFSLMYSVEGPVGTIFQPSTPIYKGLFGGLWKAKRMEYVLSNMRKQQITSNKILRVMKELKPVTHQIHILSSEMIHFLHQTQYYFLFEVLECSWAEMLKQVNQATSLDDVIVAHMMFLNSVQSGVLLDTNSADLRKYLGSIFNLILSLESIQETLYVTALREKERLDAYELKIDHQGFGTSVESEQQHVECCTHFTQFLVTMGSQIGCIAVNFRQYVIKYVSLLASSSDMNLQLLSTRLNFNDYYKIF